MEQRSRGHRSWQLPALPPLHQGSQYFQIFVPSFPTNSDLFHYSHIRIFAYSQIPEFPYSHIPSFPYSLIPIFPYSHCHASRFCRLSAFSLRKMSRIPPLSITNLITGESYTGLEAALAFLSFFIKTGFILVQEVTLMVFYGSQVGHDHIGS